MNREGLAALKHICQQADMAIRADVLKTTGIVLPPFDLDRWDKYGEELERAETDRG